MSKTLKQKEALCRVEDLRPGASKKFTVFRNGQILPAFLIRYEGKFYAYLNECAHVARPLDWDDNNFFTEDKKLLVCSSHGAVYNPETGECVSGPCLGESLQCVHIEVADGKIFCEDAVL